MIELDSLTRNKSRTFLTGFGIYWGVFMLVVLLGGGEGLKHLLSNTFDGFATNSAMVESDITTKPYKGFRKGRWWSMELKDIQRIKKAVPELDVVSPILFSRGGNAVYDDRTSEVSLMGNDADYQYVNQPKLRYGRYLNQMDLIQKRKVCVIGKKIYNDLFPMGGNPCGNRIEVNGVYYQIVGVDYNETSFLTNPGTTMIVPITVMQQINNRGNRIDLMALTGKQGVVMSTVLPKVRETLARSHSIDPDDTQAVWTFNTEVMFQMIEGLFKGVNILIIMVGVGTLLAGAIGVSNIMMVTVKERTTEIGIRRAIGATPRNIITQILGESVVLTLVSGLTGIVAGVWLLQIFETAVNSSGTSASFQIGFWTAFAAAASVSALGIIAGLAPALRAMSIKPVDAMREE
ncbi:MAG: ABC transporter permease [Bacteroidales bacterium]|nr:ABC transporter permease [Bacteroidales bacterium]